MTLKVKYQTARDNKPVTEQWVPGGRGWIVRPKGTYFVLPQYIRGLLDVLLSGRGGGVLTNPSPTIGIVKTLLLIISCLPLINKLYYVKVVRGEGF